MENMEEISQIVAEEIGNTRHKRKVHSFAKAPLIFREKEEKSWEK